VRTLAGVEKFESVQSCIYGPMFSSEHPDVFPLLQAVLRTTEVLRVERPAEGWTVAEVADLILGPAPAPASADGPGGVG
jgi:hypothetical protein